MGEKKKKILVADDDASILEVMEIILKDAGYDLIIVTDGKVIEKKIIELKPNLVLLDIWMAGEDGGEIAKNLKASSATKDTPIIIVSANNDTAKIAKEAGADDFLAKPFDMHELLLLIKKYV